MAKLLTVFGATGQQGGALIRYILETPSLSSVFILRGVTRDASKPASIALKDIGVEIVEVTHPDTLTHDSLSPGSLNLNWVLADTIFPQADLDVPSYTGKGSCGFLRCLRSYQL